MEILYFNNKLLIFYKNRIGKSIQNNTQETLLKIQNSAKKYKYKINIKYKYKNINIIWYKTIYRNLNQLLINQLQV